MATPGDPGRSEPCDKGVVPADAAEPGDEAGLDSLHVTKQRPPERARPSGVFGQARSSQEGTTGGLPEGGGCSAGGTPNEQASFRPFNDLYFRDRYGFFQALQALFRAHMLENSLLDPSDPTLFVVNPITGGGGGSAIKPVRCLFTEFDDVVDFDTVVAGNDDPACFYHALGGGQLDAAAVDRYLRGPGISGATAA